MKSKILYLFPTLVLVFILNVACKSTTNENAQAVSDKSNIVGVEDTIITTDSTLMDRDTIVIVGVGDMMLGTNYPANPIYLPPNNDCSQLLKDVKHILQGADVAFGNLEGALCDDCPIRKICKDPTICFAFRMPEKYVYCIKDAGFDVVSLANNHIDDFGQSARNSTTRLLNETGINYAGLLTKPFDTFMINGIKYGFCAFSPSRGTCDIRKIEEAQEIVRNLEAISDIVIVSFHGGAEGAAYQHVPKKTETFLGQNRGNVYEFAHKMIDAGADVVFGHGPHVTRAIDVYKKRFIIYSMGNFCTYSRFSLKGPNAIAPIVRISVNKDGEFLKGEIIPTYQIKYKGGPRIDPQKRAIKKIQDLTSQDLPELKSVLSIDDNGVILLK